MASNPPEPVPRAAVRTLPRALLPFRHRDFRLLIFAVSVSVFGSGMWAVAMVFQVIELGGGPVELSVVATAGSLGLVGFALVGGIAADRLPRRLILIGVEAVNLLSLASVCLLAFGGLLRLWHIAAAAALLGVAAALFYPAYSAILPRILPPDELLAANGTEGTLRPLLQQAAGPAAAGLIVAALSPAHAAALIAAAHLCAFVMMTLLRPEPDTDPPGAGEGAAGRGADGDAEAGDGDGSRRQSAWADLREGVAYSVRTPWLLYSLLFFCVLVLMVIGPIEVLLPFAVRDQLGGGAGTFGLLLACWGGGGAAGALAMSSLRMPRRYLSLMLALWGLGCLPLVVIGFAGRFWIMAASLFVVGFAFSAGSVIWGTLLQRRVPLQLLGRVSSLDFFVSLALMPISMALAGPVSTVVPIWLIFLAVGAASPLLAAAAIVIGRMRRDELEHPLDEAAAGNRDR